MDSEGKTRITLIIANLKALSLIRVNSRNSRQFFLSVLIRVHPWLILFSHDHVRRPISQAGPRDDG